MSKKIKNIIFDLGNVLVGFDPVRSIGELGFSEEAIEVFKEKIFSGLWESFDKRQEEEVYIRNLFKSIVPGYEAEVDKIWDNVDVLIPMLDYSTEWVKSLKERGYRIYILSNFGNCSFANASPTYDFLPYTDGRLISYEILHLKPEPEMYETLIARYDLDPAACVFIDDRADNIEAAEKFGITGIVFENYEQAKADLEKVLETEK